MRVVSVHSQQGESVFQFEDVQMLRRSCETVLRIAPSTSQRNTLDSHFRKPLKHGLVDFVVDKNADSLCTSSEPGCLLRQSYVQVVQFEAVRCIRHIERNIFVIFV